MNQKFDVTRYLELVTKEKKISNQNKVFSKKTKKLLWNC